MKSLCLKSDNVVILDNPDFLCFNEGLVSVGYIVCFLGSSVITCTEFVNMYHSNTPEYVKEKNCTDMGSDSGKIRVLICTNAAGMGVNFKNLNNVIHMGYHLIEIFLYNVACLQRWVIF